MNIVNKFGFNLIKGLKTNRLNILHRYIDELSECLLKGYKAIFDSYTVYSVHIQAQMQQVNKMDQQEFLLPLKKYAIYW